MAKKNPPKHPEIPGLFDDLPEDVPQEQIAKIAFQGWKNHLARFGALQKKIEGLLDEAVKKALANGGKLTADDIGRVFQKHPEIKRDLDAAIETLNKDLVAVIEKDSKDAWLRAQTNAQEITKTLAASNAQLAALLASGEDKAQNDRALRAFMKRKEAGMNLSDRVWKTTLGMKLDMERAIDVALAEGMSADRLSLKIRELLKEPHRLYRRVRDKDGNLRLSQAAQNYHPGTGVYRSSYKNAMRVARTEVNMAYQTSDSERWTNSWWVKGIRISLSNNHTIENAKGEKERLVDICDELAGDYPPDFKFTGWHPQCRCFATAITCSYDEIREYYRRKRAGEDMTGYEPKGLIKEPPQKFKNWMERNADRLAGAAERGTTPYFITNNPKYTGAAPATQEPRKLTIQERADIRHAERKPEDIEKIRENWARSRMNLLNKSLTDGHLPPAAAERLRELEDDIAFGDWAEFHQKASPLLKSAQRHASRTPNEVADIKAAWEKRNRDLQAQLPYTEETARSQYFKMMEAIRAGNLPKAINTSKLYNLIDEGKLEVYKRKVESLLRMADRHEARTPQQAADIRQKWNKTRIENAGEEKQLEEMRKAFKKNKIKTVDDIDRIMGEFYNQFPGETNNVRVKFISFDEARKADGTFTMGYSRHDVEIAFNSNDGGLKKSPLGNVIAAFDKIRTGGKLSLDQLRQVETVVHELLHQKAAEYVRLNPHYSGDYKRTAMETMNEIAARATTAKFIRRTGGSTEGVDRIMRDGLGYQSWSNRFLRFCDRAGISPNAAGHEFAKTLTTKKYDTMDAELYNFFKKHARNTKNFTQSMDEVLEAMESGTNWFDYLNSWFN